MRKSAVVVLCCVLLLTPVCVCRAADVVVNASPSPSAVAVPPRLLGHSISWIYEGSQLWDPVERASLNPRTGLSVAV